METWTRFVVHMFGLESHPKMAKVVAEVLPSLLALGLVLVILQWFK